ncbi:hypothetical protein NUW58_g7921 [Xylaria curta]|uniref:Uncharacterized protein n=1 Tax=Xylaria curta TaxID=42375 RepID=A0ACC1NCQ5_9PEZI|nr:hypothetical protein NUW58_g7921 [Xylaria curta]
MSYRPSHINDAGAEFEEDAYFAEDTFTAGRPPQYNDNNQPPESMVPGAQGVVPRDDAVTTQDRDPSHIPGIAENYPASCHTDSTTTLIADEAPAMTATTPTQACPGPRADILFLINRDYNVAVQPLTEGALAALNMDFSNSLPYGPPYVRGPSLSNRDRGQDRQHCGAAPECRLVDNSPVAAA